MGIMQTLEEQLKKLPDGWYWSMDTFDQCYGGHDVVVRIWDTEGVDHKKARGKSPAEAFKKALAKYKK